VVCLSVIVKYLYKKLKIVLGIPPCAHCNKRPCLSFARTRTTFNHHLSTSSGTRKTEQNKIRLSFIKPTNIHLMYTPKQPFVTPTCSCETPPFAGSLHTSIQKWLTQIFSLKQANVLALLKTNNWS